MLVIGPVNVHRKSSPSSITPIPPKRFVLPTSTPFGVVSGGCTHLGNVDDVLEVDVVLVVLVEVVLVVVDEVVELVVEDVLVVVVVVVVDVVSVVVVLVVDSVRTSKARSIDCPAYG